MKIKNIIILIIVVLVIVSAVFYFIRTQEDTSGRLDEFAKCLKDKGAVFYGTFWCPHCQTQKKMFGGSKQYLPYVECSTPDGKKQLQICKDNGVINYPTWKFADGSMTKGEISLKELAEKTSCQLPQ
ncbi:MAG: hypothetical protein EXS48_00430 [Candidatus Staskawiczbacteria bacterium]|nr:hypothetical protein [Candidatus Staskawiczbacteria bacterium]